MKVCLRYGSLFLFLALVSCANPYKHLQQDTTVHTTALRFKPEFDKALYRCVVNGRIVFKKFHLSGLLFFKNLEDGTTRVVFQNEMGFTFFDFEWDQHDVFKVNQVIDQLNKPALIKTLEKDMNLFLLKNLDTATEKRFRKNAAVYHRFDLEKGVVYYISANNILERIENAGKSKVITITLSGKQKEHDMPQEALFNHHKANFTIRLNKIEHNADE